MHSIQANSLIKNLIKILGFILLLASPLWISRIMLISMYKDLAVTANKWSAYIVTSLRFDFKTIAIWFSLVFVLLGVNVFLKSKLLKKISQVAFVLLFIGSLVFNFINVFYFPISKNIAGLELFTMIGGQESSIIWNYIAEYWWAVLVILATAYGALWCFNALTKGFSRKQSILIVIFGLVALVAAARGSFTLKPLNAMNAYEDLPAAMAKTAMSPTYFLLESYGKDQLTDWDFVSDEELAEWTQQHYKQYQQDSINKPNICIVLLESFGKEYTGLNQGVGPSYTPFLDSLREHAISFENAYANGLRSMDAVASVFAGVPCLMDQSFIGSLYTSNEVASIFELLKPLGYSSSFFHAADEQSMGFKAFLKAEGIDAYYAKQDYPKDIDFDGTWGIFDGPFLNYTVTQLDQQKQPWISGVFTLSSHHPYKVPAAYNYLEEGSIPIHKSIRYADIAFNEFLKTCKTKPWFENTIFIITADHSSINQSDQFRTYTGKYKIPLLVYSPKYFTPQKVEKPVQHLDLYPTVAHMAGYQDTLFALGVSLLDTAQSHVIHYESNVYNIIEPRYNLETIRFNKYSMYDNIIDPENEDDLSDSLLQKRAEMDAKLKAYIQDFNDRIISNNFK